MSIIEFTKIAVFYDGNFFSHVSNYYQFHHRRHARISISGLHEFIRQEVARTDGTDVRYCQLVDAHYFRGRLRTSDADQRDILVKERLFDDVLLREGVTTHYLPLAPSGEKGIDVWMALEAFELALLKHYEVCVLVASDGDFLPLVRKLNSVGTRVMVLGWDFRYFNRDGLERETRTAQILLREATYPVMMSERIEQGFSVNDPSIQSLFILVNEMRFRQHGAGTIQHKFRRDAEASNAEAGEEQPYQNGDPEPDKATEMPIDVEEERQGEHDTGDGVEQTDTEPGAHDMAQNVFDSKNDASALFEVYSLQDYSESRVSEAVDDDQEETPKRVTGRIQYLKEGFGFISPDTGGENIYFFHIDLVNVMFAELSINDQVEYYVGENSKGPCALEIRVLD